MRNHPPKNNNIGEIRSLTRCFYGEFTTLSDFIYYSIILEKDYHEISDFFDRSATTEIECLKDIGAAILYLGGEPRVKIMHTDRYIDLINMSDIKSLDIERILCYSAENIKRNLLEYERLIDTLCNANTVSILTRISLKKRELIYILEQIIRS